MDGEVINAAVGTEGTAGGGAGDQGGFEAGGDTAVETNNEGQEQQVTEGDQGDTQQSGRRASSSNENVREVPEKYKELFAEDRALRDAYYASRDYRSVFQTVKEAKTARQAIETYGGPEGLRDRIASADKLESDWEALNDKFTNGSKEFIDALADESEDGFRSMMPHARARWREMDPDGYLQAQCQDAFDLFEQYGIRDALKSLAGAMKDEAGVNALQQVIDWTDKVGVTAKKTPERKIDPERKKLDSERQQIAQERAEAFRQSAAIEINRHRDGEIGKHLAPLLKSKGIDFEAMRKDEPWRFGRLVKNIDQEIATMIKSDEEFKRQKDALISRGDKDGTLRLYRAKISRIAPEATRQIFRTFYFGSGSQKQAERTTESKQTERRSGGGESSGSGRIRLAEAPASNLIDRTRTPDDMILGGSAYLKGKQQLHHWN